MSPIIKKPTQIGDVNHNIIPAIDLGICQDITEGTIEIEETTIIRVCAIDDTRLWQTTEDQPDKLGSGTLVPLDQIEYFVAFQGTIHISGNCNITTHYVV